MIDPSHLPALVTGALLGAGSIVLTARLLWWELRHGDPYEGF